jgi:hypothetical protein
MVSGAGNFLKTTPLGTSRPSDFDTIVTPDPAATIVKMAGALSDS